jgi:hypothetical protein
VAIQSAVKFEGAPLANAYVRIHSIALKKNRNSSETNKHYLTYDVSIYQNGTTAAADPESQKALYCKDLQHFKIREVDPAADIPALCYADLKERIVALEWESQTSDIEDVENAIPDADDADDAEEDV